MSLTYKRAESAMNMWGQFRYEVRNREGGFLGEVFTFNTERYQRTQRWMAQRPDGTLYGWLMPYRTRKAAAEALIE